jgi:hypothetical protein
MEIGFFALADLTFGWCMVLLRLHIVELWDDMIDESQTIWKEPVVA